MLTTERFIKFQYINNAKSVIVWACLMDDSLAHSSWVLISIFNDGLNNESVRVT